MRILLIDDSADATDMLGLLLETQGHSVLVAFSGMSGIALALSTDFDMAIVDLGLPDMDGIQVIQTLHDFCFGKGCEVLVLTARNDSETRVKALTAGASGFFVKGRDITQLLEKTSSLF